jgi:3-hydroxyacyl-CoA dehydrogenase
VSKLNPKQYVGLAMRQLADLPGLEPGSPGRSIRKVGVIGAGLMGSGIAVCFLGAAIPTVLVDQKEEALAKGRKAIGKDLATGIKKGFLTEDQAKGLQVLLTTTVDYDELSDCDLIIEAVFERMDIKETVFKQLAQVAKKGAILATNTSGLDVDHIAEASGRPEDVIGLHFFSPAFLLPRVHNAAARNRARQEDSAGRAQDGSVRVHDHQEDWCCRRQLFRLRRKPDARRLRAGKRTAGPRRRQS